MEDYEIKICLVSKYIDVLPSVCFEKLYISQKEAYMKVCMIYKDIAYDLDSDLEFRILKTDENGCLLEEAELNKYYVYQMYEYGKVYLNDKLIYEPTINYEQVNYYAYQKYLEKKNIVSYETFLEKRYRKK